MIEGGLVHRTRPSLAPAHLAGLKALTMQPNRATKRVASQSSSLPLLSTPSAWRAALLRDHLDSQQRASLAQTCKSALALLLDEWPSPTLRVIVRTGDEPEDLLPRMGAALRQLATRGDKPTVLLLEQQGELQGETWWQLSIATLARLKLPNLTLSLAIQVGFDFDSLSIPRLSCNPGCEALELDH